MFLISYSNIFPNTALWQRIWVKRSTIGVGWLIMNRRHGWRKVCEEKECMAYTLAFAYLIDSWHEFKGFYIFLWWDNDAWCLGAGRRWYYYSIGMEISCFFAFTLGIEMVRENSHRKQNKKGNCKVWLDHNVLKT